jgi:hypothetical protein
MNKRIQELSDIAYKNHLARNLNSSFGRRSDYDKEFAELIVRECMSICKKNEYYNVGGEDPETIGHIRAGAMFCREDIKEYFGVEQ